MTNSTPLIQFSDVSLTLENEPRLSNVSFHIHRGECIHLTGPNGCGKSLVLELLAGLRKPTSGEIFVAGDCINHFNTTELRLLRRSMGLMLDGMVLLDDHTVIDNLLLSTAISSESPWTAKKRALMALEKCGVSQIANKKPMALSAGQRQLVMLARAIINRPVCIVADEPVAHLDDMNAQILMDLFGVFVHAGVSVLIASHHLLPPKNTTVRTITLS